MEVNMKQIEELFYARRDLNYTMEQLNSLFRSNIRDMDLNSLQLVDLEFLNEIKIILNCSNTMIYFGNSLRDIKCVVKDSECVREHEVSVKYVNTKKIIISSANLPHSTVLSREYKSIGNLLDSLIDYVNKLGNYFYELEKIDRFCTVMEPSKPTFKDDYRRILLDDRTWLHVEVTPDGLAANIQLVGQSEMWHDKLQAGLLSWDHDQDIVDNIMTVFDLVDFPQPNTSLQELVQNNLGVDPSLCGICLCSEVPDNPGVPQPLCQNAVCGVYYHRTCLFEWLVASAGNRPPAFGVATGACPTCLQPVSCNARDK